MRSSSIARVRSAFMVSAAFMIGSGASAAATGISAGPPDGFEDLIAERELVLDAYFGGVKIGEVRATTSPGRLVFHDPDHVAKLIPHAVDLVSLAQALAGPLPTNAALICLSSEQKDCGTLLPSRAGIIFDRDRFRVDIFVHPDLLATSGPVEASYLPDPDGNPSIVSLLGATLSGTSGGKQSWHIQNRMLASVGRVRLRSDSSAADRRSILFDNLSVEADRKGWRQVGGLFWAPGTELVGRRKIVGVGVSTQLDTRLDKTEASSTPLSIFLQRPAKVDLLLDSRIITSRVYPAGNHLLDTANLPNGSYEIEVRIQEDGRPVRLERQFFTKGMNIAPTRVPLLAAFAGFLPGTDRGPFTVTKTFFYEASVAYRLNQHWGLDVALLGTRDKAILESGLTFLSRHLQLRAASLLSTSTDLGVVVRASTVHRGPLSLSFDLRKVHSKDGRPLLPVTFTRGTFSEDAATGFADQGSFTQALGILGYRLGQANLRVAGLYRKTGSDRAVYSVGLTGEVPIVRSQGWDVLLQGDLRKTDTGLATFLGIRILTHHGRLTLAGAAGRTRRSDRKEDSTRLVGEAQAGWYRQLADQSQFTADGAFGRDQEGAYARASAAARLPAVNFRADALQQFHGGRDTSQYSGTIETGMTLTGGRVELAARDFNDSAIRVSVVGGEAGQTFEVVVDDIVRATVSAGKTVSIYLPPYKNYEVRLRPKDGLISGLDHGSRRVSLYPGSVAALDWKLRPQVILFGRAVDPNGAPVANADISARDGIGRTDAEGYFQIETGGDEYLHFRDPDGRSCAASIENVQAKDGYRAAGDIVCQ